MPLASETKEPVPCAAAARRGARRGRALGLGVILAFCCKGAITSAMILAAASASAGHHDYDLDAFALIWLVAMGVSFVALGTGLTAPAADPPRRPS